MPIQEEVLQPVGPKRPDAAEKTITGVTANTITPTVFITGQYQANPEAKAAELTRLMQHLLAYGVFPSINDAAERGVPAGSYVVIDDPRTPADEFSVQIVPKRFRRREGSPVDPAVRS
jgi:hypothetical protein